MHTHTRTHEQWWCNENKQIITNHHADHMPRSMSPPIIVVAAAVQRSVGRPITSMHGRQMDGWISQCGNTQVTTIGLFVLPAERTTCHHPAKQASETVNPSPYSYSTVLYIHDVPNGHWKHPLHPCRTKTQRDDHTDAAEWRADGGSIHLAFVYSNLTRTLLKNSATQGWRDKINSLKSNPRACVWYPMAN